MTTKNLINNLLEAVGLVTKSTQDIFENQETILKNQNKISKGLKKIKEELDNNISLSTSKSTKGEK